MTAPSVVDLTLSQPTQPQTSIPHRLPTVSAAEALQDLANGSSKLVKTGLQSLDSRLAGVDSLSDGGIERGKVTEVWGPSGAGKTAIAWDSLVDSATGSIALQSRWDFGALDSIDAAAPLNELRLRKQASTKSFTPAHSAQEALKRFHHVEAPSLSHLLAMVMHSRAGIIPAGTGLLVIDGLNHLLDLDYPRYQIAASNKTEVQKWQAGRRYAVLGSLATALNKVAVFHGLAIIVTTGCATRMRHDSGLGAALVPGVGGVEWESGVWNRMVIFRDFNVRYVGVQKCQGRSLISRLEVGEPGHLIAFESALDGVLVERTTSTAECGTSTLPVKPMSSPVKRRKRNVDEIADSESEDMDEYGWADTDEDAFAVDGLAGNVSTSAAAAEPG